jgi:anti-sigma regulatory factor (Ser/Thr protein kinase)
VLDLTRTRQALLEEIGAPPDAAATLVVRGSTPAELLPVLNESLSRCLADVAPERRFEELLYPLKKAVGNAYKWGNRRDPSRRITVAAVVTPAGALVSVSDEGEGFDPQAIVDGRREGRRSFRHGGSGFDHFLRSGSRISYADGGRTLLLCFVREGARRELSQAERERYGKAVDEEEMKRVFERALPAFREGGRRLESARAFGRGKGAGGAPEIQYVLEHRDPSGRDRCTWHLIGRLLPRAGARAELRMLAALADAGPWSVGDVRFPRPVALLDDPSMALLELQPSSDLRSRAREIDDEEEWRPILGALGRGLGAVHACAEPPEASETVREAIEAQRAAWQRIDRTLARRGGAERAARARLAFEGLQGRAAAVAPLAPVPIHGAFGWDCVGYAGDTLYVYGFERSRRSHPGFDLGAFLADLFRFHALRDGREGLWRSGRTRFLEAYAGGAPCPWFDELPFFEAAALLPRLDRLLRRSEERWQPKVDGLLERCLELLG